MYNCGAFSNYCHSHRCFSALTSSQLSGVRVRCFVFTVLSDGHHVSPVPASAARHGPATVPQCPNNNNVPQNGNDNLVLHGSDTNIPNTCMLGCGGARGCDARVEPGSQVLPLWPGPAAPPGKVLIASNDTLRRSHCCYCCSRYLSLLFYCLITCTEYRFVSCLNCYRFMIIRY